MHFEHVYVDDSRLLIFIATSSIQHQIKLDIFSYETLTEGFPTLLLAQLMAMCLCFLVVPGKTLHILKSCRMPLPM